MNPVKKVLVFVPFKHTITLLAEKLRKDKIPTEVISGAVKASDRTRIFKEFQENRYSTSAGHPTASGSTRRNADRCQHNRMVGGRQALSKTYAQANARIHRNGVRITSAPSVQLRGSHIEKARIRTSR